MKLVVGIACSLTQPLLAAILAHKGFQVVLHLLLHILVGHLDTVDQSFVDHQLGQQDVLQNTATVLLRIAGTLAHTYLGIAVLNVGELDNILSDNRHHLVDNHLLLRHRTARQHGKEDGYEYSFHS